MKIIYKIFAFFSQVSLYVFYPSRTSQFGQVTFQEFDSPMRLMALILDRRALECLIGWLILQVWKRLISLPHPGPEWKQFVWLARMVSPSALTAPACPSVADKMGTHVACSLLDSSNQSSGPTCKGLSGRSQDLLSIKKGKASCKDCSRGGCTCLPRLP